MVCTRKEVLGDLGVHKQAALHYRGISHTYFTDHVNLVSMYDPNGVSDSIPRCKVKKRMLWAMQAMHEYV